MANIKIMNYVVLDNGTNLRSIRIGRGIYRYTEQGMLLYSIGTLLPVIKKQEGCIGLAVVKKITMTEDTTAIEFELFEDIDKKTASALYSMYRNTTSMTATDNNDPYNTDILIPGAVMEPQVNLAEEKSKSSSYMDDIFETITRRTRKKGYSAIDEDDEGY